MSKGILCLCMLALGFSLGIIGKTLTEQRAQQPQQRQEQPEPAKRHPEQAKQPEERQAILEALEAEQVKEPAKQQPEQVKGPEALERAKREHFSERYKIAETDTRNNAAINFHAKPTYIYFDSAEKFLLDRFPEDKELILRMTKEYKEKSRDIYDRNWRVTKANYAKLKEGMSFDEVKSIIGPIGDILGDNSYRWPSVHEQLSSTSDCVITITFIDRRLAIKSVQPTNN
jgi:hypothetical protein